MSDVSITDLIAEIRGRQAECASLSEEEVSLTPAAIILLNSSAVKLADALESVTTNDDERVARLMAMVTPLSCGMALELVKAETEMLAHPKLEAVTVPTENEENAYDVAYALYGEHDTLGVEGTDPRRECFEAGWAAAIARLPVPVEPEEVTEGGTR